MSLFQFNQTQYNHFQNGINVNHTITNNDEVIMCEDENRYYNEPIPFTKIKIYLGQIKRISTTAVGQKRLFTLETLGTMIQLNGLNYDFIIVSIKVVENDIIYDWWLTLNQDVWNVNNELQYNNGIYTCANNRLIDSRMFNENISYNQINQCTTTTKSFKLMLRDLPTLLEQPQKKIQYFVLNVSNTTKTDSCSNSDKRDYILKIKRSVNNIPSANARFKTLQSLLSSPHNILGPNAIKTKLLDHFLLVIQLTNDNSFVYNWWLSMGTPSTEESHELMCGIFGDHRHFYINNDNNQNGYYTFQTMDSCNENMKYTLNSTATATGITVIFKIKRQDLPMLIQ